MSIDSTTARDPSCQGYRVEFTGRNAVKLARYQCRSPEHDEALVAARFSVISPGTERAVLCSLHNAKRKFPFTPGYSTSGVIVQAGKSLNLVPGDRVAGRMIHASVGLMRADSLFRIPPTIDLNEAAFIELAIVCLQGVRKGRVQPGHHVAIVGAGLVGQLSARVARLAGAVHVVTIAATMRRYAHLKNIVDEFIATSDDAESVSRINADVVIEATGSTAGIQQAVYAARQGGTVVVLGSTRDSGEGIEWWAAAQRRRIMMIGAHISTLGLHDDSRTRRTYEREAHIFLDLLSTKRLHVSDMITWQADPINCDAVYAVVAQGAYEHGAIIFKWACAGNDERG